MQRIRSRSFIVALLLSGVALAQVGFAQAVAPQAVAPQAVAPQVVAPPQRPAQSLGDVARANLAKQQAQEANGKIPKVITNQDLPAGSTGIPESSESQPMTMVSGVERPNPYANRYSDQGHSNRLPAEQGAGEQWRGRIQEQENRIADLQARFDRVNAAMQRSGGTAQYETPGNRFEANRRERLAMMQEMLDRQKQRLAMMEDAARHAGMDR